MEWQPIETAPNDGTTFLAYGKVVWNACRYDEAEWDDADREIRTVEWDGHEFSCTTSNPYADVMRPEVWMPLPNPPSPSGKHYDSSEA